MSTTNSEEIEKQEPVIDAVENQVEEKELEVEAAEEPAEETVQLSVEEQLSLDLENEKDKYLRLFAEFENYKRRTSKERVELFTTASKEVIQALLPVVDDFDRAIIELGKSESEEVVTGVGLIHSKLRDVLTSKGLEEVEVRAGDVFNADLHEAITQIPAPTEDMKGKIIDLIEKGYKLGAKTIRFPKVVIGS